MTLNRVKTANTTIAETQEAQVVIIAAMGSDNKPYILNVDELTGQIPVSTTGLNPTVKEVVRNVYSSVNVTTSAFVQLIASTSAAIKKWDIFDSSGQTLALASGAAASEVIFAYVAPGSTEFEHYLAAGTRVSIKALSATANTGEIVINAWS